MINLGYAIFSHYGYGLWYSMYTINKIIFVLVVFCKRVYE